MFGAGLTASIMETPIIESLTRALRDPDLVQSFSGVRTNFGPGPDISEANASMAAAYGYCYSTLVLRGQSRASLVIGRDPRPTGDAVAAALARGFLAGAKSVRRQLKIVSLGIITTPLLQTAVRELKVAGGVMVTASHNPLVDNGFKFLTGCHGLAVGKSDEAPPGALLSAGRMAQLVGKVRSLAEKEDGKFASDVSAVDENAVQLNESEHDRVKAERAYLDSLGREWGVEPHCLKPLTLGPALLDPNGGAACGINARVLEHFGVRALETNSSLGSPQHPIDTDGIDPRTGKHVLLRVAQAAHHAHARFGVAFDYDADRGNLVLPGLDESAIIPPQSVAALSVALALAHRKMTGKSRRRTAVVMADSTSGASQAIAELFGARVFFVETGEINVVMRMRELRDEGFDVPVGVEGANGGAIFRGSTCRDGLQTALCVALADNTLPLPNHETALSAETGFGSLRLQDILSAIPRNYNQLFRMEGPKRPHGEIKARMEGYFTRSVWPEISPNYSSYEFANYEGTRCVERRAGDESGGWRVNLPAGDERDFIFARGSRTEAGVWRMIVDSPDEKRAAALARAAQAMFREAAG